MMTFRSLLLGLLMLAGSPAWAAHGGRVVPNPSIDAVFKDFGPRTPGCALGVFRNGAVVYVRGYGMANLDFDRPITPETVFDIGSTSKQFTAAAILLLAAEGKIALADDVRKYIPELPDYGRVITIDHLLRHTSGLRDYDGLLALAGHALEDVTDDEDALRIIVAQRALNFPTGTRWSYSNTGYFLAALIVKRVSGQSLATFARDRIFGPLGMRATLYRDDHAAILKNRAVAYAPRDGGGFGVAMSNWDQLGDGGVNTTVLDLARWDGNFYRPDVGGRALVDRLDETGRLDAGAPLSYARGQFVDRYRGLRRIHHGGAWAGYRAMLMRFPDQKLSIALTCNVENADTQGRAERVADVVLRDAFKEPPPSGDEGRGVAVLPAASRDLAPVAGAYFAEETQSAVLIRVANGAGRAVVQGRQFPMRAVGPRRYALEHFPGEIILDADGRGLVLHILGEAEPAYRKIAESAPGPEEIGALGGRYHSAELGTDWRIDVDHGHASVKARNLPVQPLSWLTRDLAMSGGAVFALVRGRDGQITGFDLSAARMTGIRFDRVVGEGGS